MAGGAARIGDRPGVEGRLAGAPNICPRASPRPRGPPQAPKDGHALVRRHRAGRRGLPAGRCRAGGRRGQHDAAQRRRLPRLRRRDHAHRLLRHRLRRLGARRRSPRRAGRPPPARRRLRQPGRRVARLERALLPRGRARRRPRHALPLRDGPAREPHRHARRAARGRRRQAAPRHRGARGAQRVRPLQRAARAGRPPCATTPRGCTAGPRRTRPCARCPSSGPSLGTWRGAPQGGRPARVARPRQHPPLHGRRLPEPASTCASELARGQRRLGRQARLGDGGRLPQRAATPRATSRRRPRRAAAVYLVRTFLEHFEQRHRAHLRLRADRQQARARRGATPSSTSACCATTSRPSPRSPR